MHQSMRRRHSSSHHRASPGGRPVDSRLRKLAVETLEQRRLLSVFAVTNTDGSGPGSLSEAVEAANANPGPDKIEFSVAGEIDLGTSYPTLNDATGGTLIDATTAPGYDPESGPVVILHGQSRGLKVESDGNEIRGLGIQSCGREGILNTGELLVTSSSILGNNRSGIRNLEGVVTVVNSTIAGNFVDEASDGGGIFNSGNLTVINSVIAGNSAGVGGGIFNSAAMTVINSSIVQNVTTGPLFLGGNAGGIFSYLEFTLTNSIVAGNETPVNQDIIGPLAADSDHNLIGVWSSESAIPGENNLSGTRAAPLDPGLSDWTDLGGSDWGYLLLPDSPALNAGSNALAVDGNAIPLATDIYGNPRIQDGVVDIGAVEGACMPGPQIIYVVESLENSVVADGVLTFPEALQAASSNRPVGDAPAGSFCRQDRIEFAPGLTGTFALNGEPLTLEGNLAVEGPGEQLLTFDAQQGSRVFDIALGATVELSGMTITRGRESLSDMWSRGGGIRNRYGRLTISDSTITDNAAYFGGAIYNCGILAVNGSTFEDNLASYGGAIHNTGTLTVNGSSFRANTAWNWGGGICNWATATVESSLVTGNSATSGGGGIYNEGGELTLTITDSTISQNSSRDGSGGGIRSSGSTLIITGSTITENTAEDDDGGGISSWDDTLTITDSTIANNSSGQGGGGILGLSSTITINNSTISQNSSYYNGGGIRNSRGTLSVANSTVAENFGEGILSDGALVMANTIITGNTGGGIFSNDTTTITNSTITGNSRRDKGGGIEATGTLTVHNSIVAQNFAPENPDVLATLIEGADYNLIGVWDGESALPGEHNLVGTLETPLDPELGDCTGLEDGYRGYNVLPHSPARDAGSNALAVDADGLPLMTDRHGDPRVENGMVDIGAVEGAVGLIPAVTYVVEDLGGGIATDGVLTFREALAAANSNQPTGDAPAGSFGEQDRIEFAPDVFGTFVLDGQALMIHGDLDIAGPDAALLTFDAQNASRVIEIPRRAEVVLSGMTVTGGNAVDGGGIYNSFGTLTVAHSTISSNMADGWEHEGKGGGIYSEYGTLAVADSTITENSASGQYHPGGGGIFSTYGTLTVTRSTIAENRAGRAGGGICSEYGTAMVTGSTIMENSGGDGGGIYSAYGPLTVTDSTIGDNSGSYGGGIDADTVAVAGSVIADNRAEYGGGVYGNNGSAVTVNNSTIENNSAKYYGGGIFGDTVTVTNATMTRNTAGAEGGGIEGNTVNVVNSTIAQNSAETDGGGIFGETVTVTNATIAKNTALLKGGGIYADTLAAANSIVARNLAVNDPDVAALLTAESDYNLIGVWSDESALPGEHTLSGTFQSPLNPGLSAGHELECGLWGYSLLSGSPALNAGSNTLAVDTDGLPLATDQCGNPRIQDGTVDMGATEGAMEQVDPVTYVVESLDDTVAQDGILTFREAFEAANANQQTGDAPAGSPGWPDRIEFGPGVSGTFILSGQALEISDSLVIEGPGAEQLTFDALGSSRVFEILPHVQTTLSGMRITGGNAIDGGGIFAHWGTLTIADATVTGNTATSNGGGIYNSSGTLTLDNAVVAENWADDEGGGLFNDGLAIVTDSSIVGNEAAWGGGVYSHGGGLLLTNSSITDNRADGNGGGIFANGEVTVSRCSLTDNRAGSGGGIYGNVGDLTVVSSSVARNAAVFNGGGIYENAGELTVVNSSVVKNLAEDSGGGVFGTGVTVINSNIVGNSAGNSGGGLNGEMLAITNSIVARNRADEDPDFSGNLITGSDYNLYGIWSDGSGPYGEHNLVGDLESPLAPGLSNWTDLGDGVWGYLLLPGSPALNAGSNALAVDADGAPLTTDLYGNPRIQQGVVDMGAVEGATEPPPAVTYVVQSLDDSIAQDGILTFREAFEAANSNQPVGDALAGSFGHQDRIEFALGLSGTFLLDGNALAIDGDLAIEGPGAARLAFDAQGAGRVFEIRPDAQVALTRITISGGSAVDGGGIYNLGGSLTLASVEVTGNSAEKHGGGVFNDGTMIVTGSTIQGNSPGGGISNAAGTLTVANSTVSANSPGGISNKGELHVVDTIIVGNSYGIIDGGGTATIIGSTIAENSPGGGILGDGLSALILVNSTVARNSSSNGGGIRLSGGTLDITDCIVADNEATLGGGGIYLRGAATVASSIISNNRVSDIYGKGGGIYCEGDLTVINSTITGNAATHRGGWGGGFYVSGHDLTINASTVAHNSAFDKGGGIYAYQGTLNISNSTFTQNSAGAYGGTIFCNAGSLTVANSTVAENTAAQGCGGLYEYGGTFVVANSIVASNTGAFFPDVFGSWDAQSHHNLIGICSESPATYPNSLFGTDAEPLDARLGPLGDYGGPTATMPLLGDSPAIDAGDSNLAEAPPADQRGFARIVDGDGNDTATIDMGAFEFAAPGILRRQIFYNNSAFDGGDPLANEQDDDAIAADKSPLLPGNTAGFANYTSFSRGINGIMIDVVGLSGTPTAADFGFRVGNDENMVTWNTVAAVPTVDVREGQGVAGSDRVTIIFDDNVIQNQWLQVTVLGNGNTGLAEPDVFYFGNAIGESGNSATDAKVNAIDILLARNNPRTLVDPAPIDFRYDYNRDRRVNATDMLLARENQTHLLDALKLITVAEGNAKARMTKEEEGGSLFWYEIEQMIADRRERPKSPAAAEDIDKLLDV